MLPLIFQSLPEVFSVIAGAVLVQVCALLLITGKRYLTEVSMGVSGIAGAVIGEGAAMTVHLPGFVGILPGLATGAILSRYLRPLGMGLALAFLTYSVASSLIPYDGAQYVSAIVMFSYGILLTDLAPSFASGLLASAILLLLGELLGMGSGRTLEIVTVVASARVLASLLPRRVAARNQHPKQSRIEGNWFPSTSPAMSHSENPYQVFTRFISRLIESSS